MTSPLERRVQAAQATLNEFSKRPFRLGRDDCWELAKFHLRAIGKPLSVKVKRYRTPSQAKAELKRLGVETVGGLLDPQFERKPPASAVVGDILELKGVKGMTGLVVALGNGRVVGYHEDIDGAGVLQPTEYLAAWRVL